VLDDYDSDYTLFNVCGNDIRILDDELAEALKKLSDRNRENLLMYYFLEMSDTEIAKLQNISRSGVFQNRYNSLELMKKLLKGEK
ncbi:TPA: RNA polymerase sigma factor, partial [Clostridioides difficile]